MFGGVWTWGRSGPLGVRNRRSLGSSGVRMPDPLVPAGTVVLGPLGSLGVRMLGPLVPSGVAMLGRTCGWRPPSLSPTGRPGCLLEFLLQLLDLYLKACNLVKQIDFF